jgi:hypothetical protein
MTTTTAAINAGELAGGSFRITRKVQLLASGFRYFALENDHV